MNLNDAYTLVIEVLLEEASNPEYTEKLNIILAGIKNKKNVEQEFHPRFQSIVLFGHNMFPYKNEVYIQIAEYIKGIRNGNI